MSFQWQAPEAKKKVQGKPADTSAAASVAAEGVTVEASICRLRTLVDGGLRIEIDLPELEPVKFALLYPLRNRVVNLTIKDPQK